MDWKKFWAPVSEEMRKEQIWVNIIGGLGILPAGYIGKMTDSFLVCMGIIVLWYILVFFLYLIYMYNKH